LFALRIKDAPLQADPGLPTGDVIEDETLISPSYQFVLAGVAVPSPDKAARYDLLRHILQHWLNLVLSVLVVYVIVNRDGKYGAVAGIIRAPETAKVDSHVSQPA
jgi:hypothetical protein